MTQRCTDQHRVSIPVVKACLKNVIFFIILPIYLLRKIIKDKGYKLNQTEFVRKSRETVWKRKAILQNKPRRKRFSFLDSKGISVLCSLISLKERYFSAGIFFL